MAKADVISLGKVVKVEGGIATTDSGNRSICKCKVGDVLEQNRKNRKVYIKAPASKKAPTAAASKKELVTLQKDASDKGISLDDIEGKTAEELKALIEAAGDDS